MAFTPTFKERTAEDLLEHWGRWVVLGSGVSCCASRENTVLSPMITDDDALMIDGLMGRLLKRYPECGQVLMKYYTSRNASLMEVGKEVGKKMGKTMGFGEEKTRGLWKAGIAWIDGALDIRRQAA